MCRRGARLSGQRGGPVYRQKEHSCTWKRDNTKTTQIVWWGEMAPLSKKSPDLGNSSPVPRALMYVASLQTFGLASSSYGKAFMLLVRLEYVIISKLPSGS
jgi:hypothetical protein